MSFPVFLDKWMSQVYISSQIETIPTRKAKSQKGK
jgi:hypothetical protein